MADYTDKLTLAAWNAATEGRGNTKLVWGTYTGTGEYNSTHPVTLTFPGTPLYFCVRMKTPETANNTYNTERPLCAYAGQTTTNDFGSTKVGNQLTWGDNSVSFESSTSAAAQANEEGKDYYYIALVGM